MSLLLSLAVPKVGIIPGELSGLFLYNQQYLLATTDNNRRIYHTDIQHFLNRDPSDREWTEFFPPMVEPGDELLNATITSPELLMISDSKTKYNRNLELYTLSKRELDFDKPIEWIRQEQNGLLIAHDARDHYRACLFYIPEENKLRVCVRSTNNLFEPLRVELDNPSDELDLIDAFNTAKIRYIPEINTVLLSAVKESFVRSGIKHSFQTGITTYHSWIDFNHQSVLMVNGAIENIFTGHRTKFVEVQNNPAGKWWVPLGFTKSNNTYWIQFQYNNDYIQPTEIMLMPDGRKWSIPCSVTKSFILEEMQKEISNVLRQRNLYPQEAYTTLFSSLGEYFWKWETNDKLDSLLLWCSRSLMYVHSARNDVWLSPSWEQYFNLIDVLAKPISFSDDGLIILQLSDNEFSDSEQSQFVLYYARPFYYDILDRLEPKTRAILEQNELVLTETDPKFKHLPAIIQSKILINTLNK